MMAFIFFWLLFSAIPAVIASNKGRSGIGWFFVGLLVSPLLALILVLVLAPIKKAAADPTEERVSCPLCKEQISSEALRCPHCQGDIADLLVQPAPTPEPEKPKEEGEFVGLGAIELLNVVRYKKFAEEKRRAAMARLLEKFPGSREASEATQILR